MVKKSIKTGLGFGMTSGVITTLGLIMGLSSGTNSQLAVIGGILTIAIADALSDALGIHISEESKNNTTEKQVWASTLSTLFFKFVFAITFLVPVLILPLDQAVVASIGWGFLLIAILSIYIARENQVKAANVVAEHLIITAMVVASTHYLGIWISNVF